MLFKNFFNLKNQKISEEKERPGTRSHESSTTSLPNDYISKSDSYDNNFLESNVNTLEISPILGQEERRCRNCHKVLPQVRNCKEYCSENFEIFRDLLMKVVLFNTVLKIL